MQWWGQKWSRTKIYECNLDLNENLGPTLDILDIFEHFWTFLAFKMSKNAFPGFVCIPLCLLSEAPPGGTPSMAFLRKFDWNFELQKSNDSPVLAKVRKNAYRFGLHPEIFVLDHFWPHHWIPHPQISLEAWGSQTDSIISYFSLFLKDISLVVFIRYIISSKNH